MSDTVPKVADFVSKLYSILQDEACRDVICWTDSEFVIKDSEVLVKQILPRYYRHSKLQSFIRQLNLYGFRKLAKPYYKKYMFFKNDKFKKGCKDLLHKIQLKNKLKSDIQEDVKAATKQKTDELEETRVNFKAIVQNIYHQLKSYQNQNSQLQQTASQAMFLLRMCGVGEYLEHQEPVTSQVSVTNFLTRLNFQME